MQTDTYTAASRYHPERPFLPKRSVRSGLVQTLLSRAQPADVRRFTRDEQPILLDAGPDMTEVEPDRPVRLLGYYNRAAPASEAKRGLVLSLHGWEGCSHSHHNLMMGASLLEAGYDLFRLNLRDHGPNLHVHRCALNKGLFLGTLIDEVAVAAHRIAEMAGDAPFYIVGPSMGGNFALRLALRQREQPIRNLAHVVAISPAINPATATETLDAHPLYRRYFRERWLGSLRAKQRLFPDLYDFADMDLRAPLHDLTDALVRRFGFFDSADAYFRAYTITGDAFQALAVPTTIITAANDPVIPVAEFYTFAHHPLLKVEVHPSGGHVGFADVFPLRQHLPEMVLQAMH